MGAGHAHVHLGVPLARSANVSAATKIAAAMVFAVGVVAVPRGTWWPFAAAAVALAATAALGGVRPIVLLRGLRVVVPLVVGAGLLPFLARAHDADLFGLGYSTTALGAAGAIVAKTLLGCGAGTVLAATTPAPEMVRGLQRLRIPAALVAILAFMLRYFSVVHGEMQRMQTARVARGDDPRWIGQTRAIAQSAGALFVRSYERGERVHLAMAARGYTGALPATSVGTVERAAPAAALGAWAAPIVVVAAVAVARTGGG